MKKCSKCKIKFPLAEFYLAKDTIDKKGSWCKGCYREQGREKYKLRTKKDKIRTKKYADQWRKNNRDRCNELGRLSHERRRFKVLQKYGGKFPKCACCGISEIKFLSIDHINGGGLAHLRSIGGRGSLMGWIIKNNFPVGFQILCHNCNFAKGHYGKCPHNKKGDSYE